MSNQPGLLVYTDSSQVQRMMESEETGSFLNAMRVTQKDEFIRKIEQIFQAGSGLRSCFFLNLGYGSFVRQSSGPGGCMPCYGVKGRTPGITRNANYVHLRLGRESDFGGERFNYWVFGTDFLTGEETIRLSESDIRKALTRRKKIPSMGIWPEERDKVCRLIERLWHAQETDPRTRLIVRLKDAEGSSMRLMQQVYQLLPYRLRLQMGFETNISEADLDRIQKDQLPIFLVTADEKSVIDKTRFLFPVMEIDLDGGVEDCLVDRLSLLIRAADEMTLGQAEELDRAEKAAIIRAGKRYSSFAVYGKALELFLSGEVFSAEEEMESRRPDQASRSRQVLRKPAEPVRASLDMEDVLRKQEAQAQRKQEPAVNQFSGLRNQAGVKDGPLPDKVKGGNGEESGKAAPSLVEKRTPGKPIGEAEENRGINDKKRKPDLIKGQSRKKAGRRPNLMEAGKALLKKKGKVPEERDDEEGTINIRSRKKKKNWLERLVRIKQEREALRRQKGGSSKKEDAGSRDSSKKVSQTKTVLPEKKLRREVRRKKNDKTRRRHRLILGGIALLLVVFSLTLIIHSLGKKVSSGRPEKAEVTVVPAEKPAALAEKTDGTISDTTEETVSENVTPSLGGEPAATGDESTEKADTFEGGPETQGEETLDPQNYVSDWEAVLTKGLEAGIEGKIGDSDAEELEVDENKILYFHIAFASEMGGDVSTDTSLPYIATYLTATTNPNTSDTSCYEYFEISSLVPSRGLPGKYLDSETEYYLHIAYAEDDQGGSLAPVDDGRYPYIGCYFDNEEADSEKPGVYHWIQRKTRG